MLDQTGLAQKGGAVTCHLRIARALADIHAVRIACGRSRPRARLRHGGGERPLGAVEDPRRPLARGAQHLRGHARQLHHAPGSQFPAQQIIDTVKLALAGEQPELVDATEIATALLGDSIATNLFMLGYAWQKGWVPCRTRPRCAPST